MKSAHLFPGRGSPNSRCAVAMFARQLDGPVAQLPVVQLVQFCAVALCIGAAQPAARYRAACSLLHGTVDANVQLQLQIQIVLLQIKNSCEHAFTPDSTLMDAAPLHS